ncbi:MAG: Rpn family recombination-promoting nuclease/putative transposase [Magnetococcales bacterium]|nr:Rpn family recombination-promoting nuclease/putative transposase [Magnetococcales bacterium]
MADYDSGYKQLFSHADMVRDLLQGFIREEWIGQLDFSSLEKVSGSYVTDDLRDREDDIIWRIRWGQTWLYVYLLLEFQSTVDWIMSVRMTAYVMLLYQDLVKSGQVKHGEKLPAVLPVVLYNGKPEWTAALEVSDLITSIPGGLDPFRPRMRYLLIDETRYGDAELESMQNLSAALFRLEKSRTPQEIRNVLKNLIDWLKAPGQSSLRRAFTVMLGRVLLPKRLPGQSIQEFNDLQGMDAMLAETVQEWTQQWKSEGLQEGLKKGLKEGRKEGLKEGRKEEAAAILLKQIRRKFGHVPDGTTEKIKSAEVEVLEIWSDNFVFATSLDDVFSS